MWPFKVLLFYFQQLVIDVMPHADLITLLKPECLLLIHVRQCPDGGGYRQFGVWYVMNLAKSSPCASDKVGIQDRQGDHDLLLDDLSRKCTDSGRSRGVCSWRSGRGGGFRLCRFATSRGRAFGSGGREGGVYTRESNVLKQSVSRLTAW